MTTRSRSFTVRASDEEMAMLAALAEQEGISISDFLRLHIRRAYALKFGDKKPHAGRKGGH